MYEDTRISGQDSNPVTELGMSVVVSVDRNATVSTAVAYLPHTTMSATGAAKRENGDPHRPDIALELAAGRALISLGRRMVASGRAGVTEATAEQDILTAQRQLNRNRRMWAKLQPAGSGLSEEAIRERWGDEAAARHAARQMARARVEEAMGLTPPEPAPARPRRRAGARKRVASGK